MRAAVRMWWRCNGNQPSGRPVCLPPVIDHLSLAQYVLAVGWPVLNAVRRLFRGAFGRPIYYVKDRACCKSRYLSMQATCMLKVRFCLPVRNSGERQYTFRHRCAEASGRKSGEVAPGVRLLRTYWYDGLPRANRPTPDQNEISDAADNKLRLGMVNSQGEQKGVDSLIVTDLIELARNRAISDALILSGDEDIRIGVQVAQTYGIRIHLLGIRPARGSQSADGSLRQ